MKSAVALALLALLALGACAGEHRSLEWQIEFETPALRDRAARVEATIRRGGCTGEVIYRADLRPGGVMAMRPPVLEDGSYGFVAAAIDASCVRFANACEIVDLPGATTTTLRLRQSSSEIPDCLPSECASGTCGGRLDGGLATDGTTGVDARPPGDANTDACPPVGCGDASGDECDGAPDGDACAGGAGRCFAGACCTGCTSGGACHPGTNMGTCGFGGYPCIGCLICADGVCPGGDTCAAPFDISAGGYFPIDTCALHDDADATCGTSGTRDVILRGAAPMSGSTYFVAAGPGWAVQQIDSACSPWSPSFSCGDGMWGVTGNTADGFWWFAVERQDGGCGRVNIRVDRTM